MKARGSGRPLMGKFCTARCVCAPHSASAGTLQLAHAVALGPKRSCHSWYSGTVSLQVLTARPADCRMRYDVIRNLRAHACCDATELPPSRRSRPSTVAIARATEPLRALLSEAGLIRERIRIEALWLLHLARGGAAAGRRRSCPRGAARARQALAERSGRRMPPPAVKAHRSAHQSRREGGRVLRARAAAAPPARPTATLELVHFGCTSEDINNLSYARCWPRRASRLLETLERDASRTLDGARAPLCRHWRCWRARMDSPPVRRRSARNSPMSRRGCGARGSGWQAVAILGKWNGAVGNFNAHVAALPRLRLAADQPALRRVAAACEYNPYTTQIEPHDWIAEYCDALAAINVILIDLCRDIWGYISLGYLRQRAGRGRSRLLDHAAQGQSDRLRECRRQSRCRQRAAATFRRQAADLALAARPDRLHRAAQRRRRAGPHADRLASRCGGPGQDRRRSGAHRAPISNGAWEVLGEAVQTVLRAQGVPDGYERLKDFTRGRAIDARTPRAPSSTPCRLPAAEKARLQALTPAGYTSDLAARAGAQHRAHEHALA